MPPSSPLTPEEEKWIVTTFPLLNSLATVNKKFRIVFKVIPKQVLQEKCTLSEASSKTSFQICEENIVRMKEMFEEDNTISIR